MHRYSRRANGEADAGEYSSHSRLRCAVTPSTRRTNPTPEASWTLCIGGRETQGQVEVHVVVIPSEDRNRLSLLDWCKTGATAACGERSLATSQRFFTPHALLMSTNIGTRCSHWCASPAMSRCHVIRRPAGIPSLHSSHVQLLLLRRPPGASARSKMMKGRLAVAIGHLLGVHWRMLTSKRVVRCLARRHSTTAFACEDAMHVRSFAPRTFLPTVVSSSTFPNSHSAPVLVSRAIHLDSSSSVSPAAYPDTHYPRSSLASCH